MAEIVAKSKMYRQARAEEKEKQIDLTEKLDEDFDRLAGLMFRHPTGMKKDHQSSETKQKKQIDSVDDVDDVDRESNEEEEEEEEEEGDLEGEDEEGDFEEEEDEEEDDDDNEEDEDTGLSKEQVEEEDIHPPKKRMRVSEDAKEEKKRNVELEDGLASLLSKESMDLLKSIRAESLPDVEDDYDSIVRSLLFEARAPGFL
jgi:hypothetical protein